MSGICAVWDKRRSGAAGIMVRAMCRDLSPLNAGAHQQAGNDEAAFAVCTRFAGQGISDGARVLAACDADLLNAEELARRSGVDVRVGNAAIMASLYEACGPDFARLLRGSFSVVLWDKHRKQMIAAVDGFAIKRLVFYEDHEVLLVASRIDALIGTGRVDRAINPRTIANYLNYTAALAPDTIFAKVRRLIPGGLLQVFAENTRVSRYWDMQYSATAEGDERKLAEQLESVVESSVDACCRGVQPDELGAFLSGGTDSSTVVGMMTRALHGPVRAFSIGFKEQRFNELEYARIAASRFGSDHHTYLVGADDCINALPHIVRQFDEPFGNSSAIPTYFCARMAADAGVKILLAGDGGDELFGGNERYRTDKIFQLYQSVPQAMRKGIIEPVLNWIPARNGIVDKARSYVRRSNIPGTDRFISYQFLSAHPPAQVFEPEFVSALQEYRVGEVPASYYEQAPAREHLDRLLYVDLKITLGDNDLPKVTCMSELAGIQSRFPFLDRPVAEFSGRVPARLKLKRLNKRHLFKVAFRKLLPAEIIRKTKHGFGIPVADWLKSDLRMRELCNDVLLAPRASERGYFRRGFVESLLQKHKADDSGYYGDAVWALLALELWHINSVDRQVSVAI